MAAVEVPVVEAAPQDAHNDTDTRAQQTIVEWRKLAHQDEAGSGVRVGVIDTLAYMHPWFSQQVQGDRVAPGRAKDLLKAGNYTAGHATFIAGLVLQQAPAANVVVRGVLDEQGHATTAAVILAARDLVAIHGIDVLNLSCGAFGTATEKAEFESLLNDLGYHWPKLVVVAAAGNKRIGETRSFYPGALADHVRVVAVGAATDPAGKYPARFSNQGSFVTFLAEGQDLVSTFFPFARGSSNPEGRWARWSGTSFSTAVVSGMIAATMCPGPGCQKTTAVEAVAALRPSGSGGGTVSLARKAFPGP